MKRNIKKYSQFIKENVESPNQKSRTELLRLREEFRDKLNELSDYKPDLGIAGTNFSSMCKWEDVDLEEDFKKLQNVVDKHGYTIDTIKELFSQKANEICRQNFKDFVENRNFLEYKYREPLDEKNGNVDFYLYKISEIVFNPSNYRPLLGGDEWSFGRNQLDKEEFMIRFAYGYHQTKYGQLYIEQHLPQGKSLEDEVYEWDVQGYKELGYWFSGDDNYEIKWKEPFHFLSDEPEYREFINNLEFDKYVLIEQDRIIIWAKELAEDLENFKTRKKITFEYLYSEYVKMFDQFKNIDVIETGEEIIVRLHDFKLDASM
jgi:hypothetical protein